MSDVADIAGKLTEAQRRAMLDASWIHPGGQEPICLVRFTDPWTEPVAQFFTMHSDRLTDLGKQVRTYLESRRG